MAVVNASGTPINKGSFPATTYTDPDPVLVLSADVYETYAYPTGSGADSETKQSGQRLLFKSGAKVRTSVRDALYPAGTVATITPATGTTAGGTKVVIKGTNLSGSSSVTFGGAAGTAFSVDNDRQVTVTTPAHTAGAVSVVVTDDSGVITTASGFTFA